MAGWLTNAVPNANAFTGAETFPLDSNASNGVSPQSSSVTSYQLSNMVSFLGNGLDKTMVSGTRYYVNYTVGTPQTFTGVGVRLGTAGGTDNWIVELHGPTGLLLATSATAGTLAGTAATWQQIPFTVVYTVLTPGTYYIALQGNGTTAKFDSVNAPALTGVVTGSATGSFGTGASITPPTTYTANLGPKVILY